MDNERRDLADELLIAEFNYIAQTAFQANEDRAKVYSVYTVAVATLIAALFSAQLNPEIAPEAQTAIFVGFSIAFAIVAVFGLLSMLQLIQLRLAWSESARAMNAIKEFVLADRPEATALLWTNATLPSGFKFGSIAFLNALQVAIISGVMCGAGIMYAGFITLRWWWGPAIGAGLLYSLLQIGLFWLVLRRKR
ncbi:MAG: hypothetical protein HC802_23305 [Caldilineaceae bacterium]|nr:hypothetical protein [Caldilineaceae bacterium]